MTIHTQAELNALTAEEYTNFLVEGIFWLTLMCPSIGNSSPPTPTTPRWSDGDLVLRWDRSSGCPTFF
jgi:hypothetical protein